MNIYQKLLEIQKVVNGLGKDSKSFGYQYVSGTKVISEIKPLMNRFGLLLKQEVLSIDNERQDYQTKSGNKSEILSKVMMRFTWIDCETGETDVNLFGANGQNDWEKGLGSALTYAERYFLLKYFHIATDEDDIDNEQRKKTEPVKEVYTPTEPVKEVYTPTESQKKTEPVKEVYTPTESQKSEFALLLLNEKITDKQRKLMTDEFNTSQSDSRTVIILNRIKELINGKFD